MLIRVIDLETTGFEPPAEVIEIGWVDLVPVERDLLGAPTRWEVTHQFRDYFVKPEGPIPPETSAIHHIVEEDVSSGMAWPDAVIEALSLTVAPAYRPTVLAAHSAKFERLWLTDEVTSGLPWICTYKAALRLWPESPSHSNQCLRYWRRPAGLIREIASVAHRAMPDAYVTAFLLRDMLNEGAKVEDLIAWTNEPALQVTCQIGKWRGSKWRDVDDGFLSWISVRDFGEDVLFTVRTEMDRRDKDRAAKRQAAMAGEDEPF